MGRALLHGTLRDFEICKVDSTERRVICGLLILEREYIDFLRGVGDLPEVGRGQRIFAREFLFFREGQRTPVDEGRRFGRPGRF